MNLITRSGDGRLTHVVEFSDWVVLEDSLRAALAAKEKAEGALCRARELFKGADGGEIVMGQRLVPDGFWTLLRAALSSSSPCQHEEEAKRLVGADAMIRAIEEQFPDWRDHRDLSECIRATLEWIRAKALTAWDQGFREGESKQAILEIRGRDKFMEDMKIRQEDIAALRREIAELRRRADAG